MVLLIVDTQKLITNDSLFRFNVFVSNVRRLIGHARQTGVEVIYIRHDDGEGKALTKGTDGYEISEEFAPASTEKIFDKCVNSPFKDTGLLSYLLSKGEKRLMIAGLQTDYCIDAAVKCGFEHGFEIIVPAYANTTVDNAYMTAEKTYEYYNRFLWPGRYAACVPIDEAVGMMQNDHKGHS